MVFIIRILIILLRRRHSSRSVNNSAHQVLVMTSLMIQTLTKFEWSI